MADRQAQDLRPPFSLNSALAPQSVSTALLERTEQVTRPRKEAQIGRMCGFPSTDRITTKTLLLKKQPTNHYTSSPLQIFSVECSFVALQVCFDCIQQIKPTNTIPSFLKINPLSFFGCFSSVFRAGQISKSMCPFSLWFTGASQEGIVSDTRIRRQIWSNQMQPF